MVFQSNPGFVFHDSRGFEAGGVDEFNTVKKFITERSKEKRLQNQLHAIWYVDMEASPAILSVNNYLIPYQTTM